MKKKHYPKQMTIRYDEKHEKELKEVGALLGTSTMSKTFLRSISTVNNQSKAIRMQTVTIERLNAELEELRTIVRSFKSFEAKLNKYTKKDEAKQHNEAYHRTE